jgi:hypothetical protein
MPRKPKPKTTSYVKIGSTKITVPAKMVGYDNALRPHLWNTTTPKRHNISTHNHIQAINLQVNPNSIRKISRVPFTSQYVNFPNNLGLAAPAPVARARANIPNVPPRPIPRQPPALAPVPNPLPIARIAQPFIPPPPPPPARPPPPPPPAPIVRPRPPVPIRAPRVVAPFPVAMPVARAPMLVPINETFEANMILTDALRNKIARNQLKLLKEQKDQQNNAALAIQNAFRNKKAINKVAEKFLMKRQREVQINRQLEDIKKTAATSILKANIKRTIVLKTNKQQEDLAKEAVAILTGAIKRPIALISYKDLQQQQQKLSASNKIKDVLKKQVFKIKASPIFNDYKQQIKDINRDDVIETAKVEDNIAIAEKVITDNSSNGLLSLFTSISPEKQKKIDAAKKEIQKEQFKLKKIKDNIDTKKQKQKKLFEKRLSIITNNSDINAKKIREEYAIKLQNIYRNYKEQQKQKKIKIDEKAISFKQKQDEKIKLDKEIKIKRDKKIKDMEEEKAKKLTDEIDKKKKVVKDKVQLKEFEANQKEKELEKIIKNLDKLMDDISDLDEKNALLFIDEDYDKKFQNFTNLNIMLDELISLYNINKKKLEPTYSQEIFEFISILNQQFKEQKAEFKEFNKKGKTTSILSAVARNYSREELDAMSMTDIKKLLIYSPDGSTIITPSPDTSQQNRDIYNAYQRKENKLIREAAGPGKKKKK